MMRIAQLGEAMGLEHRRSIALVIRHPARRTDLMLVQRPPEDEDFPRIWGLPAGTLRDEESWQDAANRIGPQKLGVEVVVGRELARGSQMRRNGSIEMRLYEATVRTGQHPGVPGTDASVTQYVAWRWSEAQGVRHGADRGSLCCQLLLQVAARERDATGE